MQEDYVIEVIASTAKSGLTAWFSANFFLSFFSSGFLIFLWSMINTLQIIMLTSLFNLDIPKNAKTIMTTVMNLCAAEFVNTDAWFVEIFGFRETKVF